MQLDFHHHSLTPSRCLLFSDKHSSELNTINQAVENRNIDYFDWYRWSSCAKVRLKLLIAVPKLQGLVLVVPTEGHK